MYIANKMSFISLSLSIRRVKSSIDIYTVYAYAIKSLQNNTKFKNIFSL